MVPGFQRIQTGADKGISIDGKVKGLTSVVNEVKYGSRVYLTKNGHGQIAMINMQELDDIEKQLALYQFKYEMEKGERSIREQGTISSEDLRKELGL